MCKDMQEIEKPVIRGKKTCGPRALIKSLPSKKKVSRTGETERNGDNITLGFLLVLEREHTFLIQIIELATL